MMKQKIDLKHLDKSNWQPFKFEDIVEKISETVKPEEADVDIYVGLEHLDREDIHIRRHGVPADVKGGKLRCYPGDIIFGKRRAYQRKAAIVDFDGICSAHAFVFRAKPEVIDPKLLPFFFHSDEFMHRMVDISVGGLSPTINWGDLKQQEFYLPPKDQQAQLAELLWALDDVIESEKEVFDSINVNIKAVQKELFNKENYSRFKLENYATVLGGYAFSSKAFTDSGVPVIKIKNIVNGKIVIDENSNHVCMDESTKANKYALRTGHVLIAMTGATLGKIGVVQSKFDGALLNQRVGKFEIKTGIDESFIRGILDSDYFLRELKKYIGEGAQGNISSEDITKTLVPELDKSEMVSIGKKFKTYSHSLKQSLLKIKSSQFLQKSLINQVF